MPTLSFLNAPRRVFAAFAIYAFAMGNFFPRMADIRAQMDVGEGALGLALIGVPAGSLTALTFAAPYVEKIGSRRILLGAIPLIALFYALAVQAPDPVTLFFMLIPIGLMIGCTEIIINLETDRAEHAAGYRIMNRAHAFWSFGFFTAGLFGAAMGGLGASPQLHLALVVPLVILALWLLLKDFEPSPARQAIEAKGPRFAAPSWPIIVLVSTTLAALLLEGGSIDWSAIFMHDMFNSGPFIAGFAVAVVAFCQFVARFFADSFVDRHSPVTVARFMLVLLLIGTLMVVFSTAAWMALAGFALIGIGSSVLFPLAISAAAQRTDRPAALNVAALAQFSFTVFLLGPPLLGVVAEYWSIRGSFAVGLPLIILGIATAGALGANRRS